MTYQHTSRGKGEPILSSEWNTMGEALEDLFGRVEALQNSSDARKAELATLFEQEDWQAPKLASGWVNFDSGYNPAGYFKDSLGIVHLRGLIKNGALSKPVFTLPEGYRPFRRELQATVSNNGRAYLVGRVDILQDGEVLVVAGHSKWLSLDGLTFRAA